MYKKVLTAIALLPIVVISHSSEAVTLRDGKTYFNQLPMLLGAETTVNRIYSSYATYYFNLALPTNLGEPLAKLDITQTEGFDSVYFRPDATIAYLITASGDRVAYPIKTEITANPEGKGSKVSVIFDPPIPAKDEAMTKRQLIIGLKPYRNPSYDGVYLFSVAASPQGDRPHSQFLGYGRLSFYDFRY